MSESKGRVGVDKKTEKWDPDKKSLEVLKDIRNELFLIRQFNGLYHQEEQERHSKWRRSKRTESIIALIGTIIIVLAFMLDIIQVQDFEIIMSRIWGLYVHTSVD